MSTIAPHKYSQAVLNLSLFQVLTMSSFTIYHNPRCSKSRQTLEILEQHGIDTDVVLYLENTPNKQKLQDLLQLLGKSPRDLLRKSEAAYKDKDTEKQLRNILVQK